MLFFKLAHALARPPVVLEGQTRCLPPLSRGRPTRWCRRRSSTGRRKGVGFSLAHTSLGLPGTWLISEIKPSVWPEPDTDTIFSGVRSSGLWLGTPQASRAGQAGAFSVPVACFWPELWPKCLFSLHKSLPPASSGVRRSGLLLGTPSASRDEHASGFSMSLACSWPELLRFSPRFQGSSTGKSGPQKTAVFALPAAAARRQLSTAGMAGQVSPRRTF